MSTLKEEVVAITSLINVHLRLDHMEFLANKVLRESLVTKAFLD